VLLTRPPGAGVQSVETACERCTVRCTVTKRRGRPPGIKETKPRKRASGVGSDDVKNQMGAGLQHLNPASFIPNMNLVGIPEMVAPHPATDADATRTRAPPP
jgi:hypothetical protein